MERQGYSNTHTHAHKQIEFIKTLFFFSYSAPKKKKNNNQANQLRFAILPETRSIATRNERKGLHQLLDSFTHIKRAKTAFPPFCIFVCRRDTYAWLTSCKVLQDSDDFQGSGETLKEVKTLLPFFSLNLLRHNFPLCDSHKERDMRKRAYNKKKKCVFNLWSQ